MNNRCELITIPTGQSLMEACIRWQQEQAKPENANIYAQHAQCANNISKVFSLAGLHDYSASLVLDLLNIITEKGGIVITLPQSQQEIVSVISNHFDGKLPTGALVAGFINEDMHGSGSDSHVGVFCTNPRKQGISIFIY